MKEWKLRYGLNPNQVPAKVYTEKGELPFEVLNGSPGYINFMDALNGWQLVRELKAATGLASAASFKHVSPAGAGTATPLPDSLLRAYHLGEQELSPMAIAYVRARGTDRMSSYGDFIALSDVCDIQTARLINREVSDGIIAPAYTEEALVLLKNKKKGMYVILKIDEEFKPEGTEKREIFGITFEQERNAVEITQELLRNIPTIRKEIPGEAVRDLLIALITLKFTQSNSVCYAFGGQTIGVGAGQQSRIHCVRLAGDKADVWHLRQHPYILSLPFYERTKLVDRDNAIDLLLSKEPEAVTEGDSWKHLFTEKPRLLSSCERKEWLRQISGISLGSDAFFPFGDNIERAVKSGVSYVAQAGGSMRDDNVIETCNKYGIAMAMTGVRLFHH
ncbi:phosphoribosylaminoimidazolecarboxamide formyltransferase/IMP cyclohydrolase/phosphoribosylaminoimidazolecarboxamide formyltransferase [Kineothrix alysoides]|uniref:Phosphoribosylaminoimidazolecarboxamide formyltransferase/IMP cyclohydrolase/phosphoribosylaminoimidazolecarboxamide formyltransferase n=1 Tax=Kineothrix alysoides TaxID=1469948 RepID=A0A4R1QQY1_9FIRM|nr:phosphoribosylaminoimidazolecarboxamide formyltransferase [Kineothrix alysoides]TCL56246.1 phosphoribosylaminoimidazolecarboxamide formyltransferase/IMP cyclohydrolase/phosphoribosylaminoimidazolecarboxamide formyltransferase [Kineothrix alysoides]